jgi:hypothetical protein
MASNDSEEATVVFARVEIVVEVFARDADDEVGVVVAHVFGLAPVDDDEEVSVSTVSSFFSAVAAGAVAAETCGVAGGVWFR